MIHKSNFSDKKARPERDTFGEKPKAKEGDIPADTSTNKVLKDL